MRRKIVRVLVGALMAVTGGLLAGSLAATPAAADHDWNGYHWSTRSYPINLRPVNSFSDFFRNKGISAAVNKDWNRSVKFANRQRFWNNGRDLRRRCPYVNGTYRMCNYNFGAIDWAGLTRIQVSGRHILRAKLWVNGHYTNTNKKRRHVLCHEVGHALGLTHRGGGSCMNATAAGWSYLRPDRHDYAMLKTIYDHRHTSLTPALEPGETHSIEHGAGGFRTDVTVAELPGGIKEISFYLRPPV